MGTVSRSILMLGAAAILLTRIAPAVAADPQSDFFQPDAFHTGVALQRRTQGLADPRVRNCTLPDGSLSLPIAVDLALCRNPATREAWAAAREQAALLGTAESAWLPTIVATGSETRSYGEHIDVVGNIVSNAQNSGDAALSLSWTLYDFGGRGGRIKGARELLEAAADTVRSVAQQTVFNTVQSFYSAVAADATLMATRATESTSARSVEIARALRDGGVASLADVLQAETAYDLAVLTRVQAEVAAKAAYGGLAVDIGSFADQPLRLVGDAVPKEVPALSARMADLMAQAQLQRPDLAAALAQRDAAASAVTVARSVGRPSISLQSARTFANTSGIPNQNYSQVGLYITVPIFNGFAVAYGVRQAQAALEASEANVDQARLQVSLGVWNAYYALDSANQQLRATAQLTQTADKNQQVALGRYQSGVGTIIDVLTAQSAAASARLLRISAEFGWQVARAQFALALGRLSGLDPLNSVDHTSTP